MCQLKPRKKKVGKKHRKAKSPASKAIVPVQEKSLKQKSNDKKKTHQEITSIVTNTKSTKADLPEESVKTILIPVHSLRPVEDSYHFKWDKFNKNVNNSLNEIKMSFAKSDNKAVVKKKSVLEITLSDGQNHHDLSLPGTTGQRQNSRPQDGLKFNLNDIDSELQLMPSKTIFKSTLDDLPDGSVHSFKIPSNNLAPVDDSGYFKWKFFKNDTVNAIKSINCKLKPTKSGSLTKKSTLGKPTNHVAEVDQQVQQVDMVASQNATPSKSKKLSGTSPSSSGLAFGSQLQSNVRSDAVQKGTQTGSRKSGKSVKRTASNTFEQYMIDKAKASETQLNDPKKNGASDKKTK